MSSRKRSTPSRKKPPAAKSLEAIAPKRRPRVTKTVGGFLDDDDDDDVPALELPGRRRSADAPPAPAAPIPTEATPDLRQALLAIEWAAARGMQLTHVQHGAATIGIASMGQPRGVKAGDLGSASSALYEQYGGAALKRELARAGTADPDEDED